MSDAIRERAETLAIEQYKKLDEEQPGGDWNEFPGEEFAEKVIRSERALVLKEVRERLTNIYKFGDGKLVHIDDLMFALIKLEQEEEKTIEE